MANLGGTFDASGVEPNAPLEGRHVYDQLNLINPNPTAEEIAQRTLAAICHAVGKLQISDSEELHFLPVMVKVAVTRNGYNEVKGYKPVQTAATGASTSAANGRVPSRPAPSSVSAAVAQAHEAAGASSTTPPWKRSL